MSVHTRLCVFVAQCWICYCSGLCVDDIGVFFLHGFSSVWSQLPVLEAGVEGWRWGWFWFEDELV